MGATALYNRSLTNHSLVYKQRGSSVESSSLQAGTVPTQCFSRHLGAANGSTVEHNKTSVTCPWQNTPMGVYACGLSFCSQLDKVPRAARNYVESEMQTSSRSPLASSDMLLVRRNRQIAGSVLDHQSLVGQSDLLATFV